MLIHRRPIHSQQPTATSRRTLLQWSLFGFLFQTSITEADTSPDPGTDIARISLLKHIGVDASTLNSAYWRVFVPLDKEAPRREPYPIMWSGSVALMFDSFDTVDATFASSYEAYPSWLDEQ